MVKVQYILKSISVFILLSHILLPVSAQEFSSESNRAIKWFEVGLQNYRQNALDQAEESFKKAIKIDSEFLEAYLLLGDVYKSDLDFESALDIYHQLIKIDDGKYPEVYFFSGYLYFEMQDYANSIEHLEKYLQSVNTPSERVSDAKFYKACALFALHALDNPHQFSPENIGQNVNTTNDEYINALKADGLTLYYTGRKNNVSGVPGGDDFYFSKRVHDTSGWLPNQKLGPPVNTSGDEGALSISPDGRYLLFAGCHWGGGFGSCDIYVSKFSGAQAGKPVNLGAAINTGAWESQPSLSSDGRTLYFASTRGGGLGKSDIWKSYLQDDGKWTKPENLGETINTTGSEMAPFIHPDGQTLYFSSDRHVGMGGIDLFLSRRDSMGNWSVPQNLGYPLNTHGDEINIVVDAAGKKGFFSANQLGGFGGFDIFEFDLYEEISPLAATYMKGVVVDAMTNKPLEAYFSLIDLKSKKEIVRSFSDGKTGEFLVCIPTDREYALNVSKENYLFHSENFSLSGIKTEFAPYLINIGLNPIVEGKIMVLRNVFFETGKFDLKEESLVELEKLIEFLNTNPQIRIEICGHTDNVGTESFNQGLSENRAKTVFDFLIHNGVDVQRLEYKGYGLSQPVSDNDTEPGRSLNRRTEIKILEVKP